MSSPSESQMRQPSKVLAGHFTFHTPCTIAWDQNCNGVTLDIGLKPQAFERRDDHQHALKLAREGADKIKELKEVSHRQVRSDGGNHLRENVLSILMEVVSDLSALLESQELGVTVPSRSRSSELGSSKAAGVNGGYDGDEEPIFEMDM